MDNHVKFSLTCGLVGIWWITEDNKVIADSLTLDEAFNDHSYIRNGFSEDTEDLRLQHEGLEMGEVIFNLRTRAYEITCSKELIQDIEKLRAIVDAFNLRDCRYDFYVNNF